MIGNRDCHTLAPLGLAMTDTLWLLLKTVTIRAKHNGYCHCKRLRKCGATEAIPVVVKNSLYLCKQNMAGAVIAREGAQKRPTEAISAITKNLIKQYLNKIKN